MSTNNLLNFQTTSQGILPIKLCVLDCDGIIFNSNQLKTAAYRSTLSDLNCSTEEISKFVDLHLSDVSVSRFVKFTAFFKDILNDPDSETKTTAALEGYSTNCMKLYKELTPEKGAMKFVDQSPTSPTLTFVISGGAQTELNQVFQIHGIRDKFHKICGSPITKIEHLSEIIKETNIDPTQILFIGDGWTDFKTSKHIGCHFCFLKEMSDWKDNVQQMNGYEEMVTRCDTWDDILKRCV
jgi:phosphoglycolate phosphatase-like HAD superfamily hydrolase